MRELAPHARLYMVLMTIAGYLAMGQLLLRSDRPPFVELVVLLLLALTCGPLRIRFWRPSRAAAGRPPCEDSIVSVGLVFVFAALLELPERYAALVCMTAVFGQLRFGRGAKPKLLDYLFRLSAANLSFLLAHDAYYLLAGSPEISSFGALLAAALLYFLFSTGSLAAAVSLENDRSIVRTWFEDFLPTAPMYLVMALCGALLSWALQPSSLHTFILLFPVICLFYYCYEFYFGRLRAERDHAREMSEVHRQTVTALALAIDAKDGVTSGHLQRVQRYTVAIGRRMGCTTAEVKALEIGALLHDIGKIAVPERLLSKPGKLTKQEFNQMAVHPQVGAEIISAVNFPFPVAELVHCHHENWDGSGYPRGLKGLQIPLPARILTVVDCFDALISDRPYRPAFPVETAVEMIRNRRGVTFDPKAVDVLLEMLPQFQAEVEEAVQENIPWLRLRSPRAIEAVQTSMTVEEQALEGISAAPAVAPPNGDSLRLQVADVMRVALSGLSHVTTYDACAVFLLEDHALVSAHQTWPNPMDPEPLEVSLHEGPTGWVASHAETLVNGNPVAESGGLGWIARAHRWRDTLIVPLWDEGKKVVGTLNLYSKNPRVYTEDQARLLELMTANLGSTLLRSRRMTPAAKEPNPPAPLARKAAAVRVS